MVARAVVRGQPGLHKEFQAKRKRMHRKILERVWGWGEARRGRKGDRLQTEILKYML